MYRLVRKIKTETIKKVYFFLGILGFILMIAGVVSTIMTFLMISTNDYYTIELQQSVPKMSVFMTIQPVVMVGSLLMFVINIKLSEVMKNVCRERRERRIERRTFRRDVT